MMPEKAKTDEQASTCKMCWIPYNEIPQTCDGCGHPICNKCREKYPLMDDPGKWCVMCGHDREWRDEKWPDSVREEPVRVR